MSCPQECATGTLLPSGPFAVIVLAYLLRLQVSMMPRKRDMPYDAYSLISFFGGKFPSDSGRDTHTIFEKRPFTKRRLALFFDVTWNIPENNTNVWRLYLMLGGRGADGIEQETFYDEGVGTKWYDRLTGGAFGAARRQNRQRIGRKVR